jgi:hypothetical protein
MDSNMADLASELITKNSNFHDLEKITKSVLEHEQVKLQIPNKLKYSGGFGIEGAALQVIATWLRSSSSQIIHTFVQDLDDPEAFADFCNSLFGLCAVRLASEVWTHQKQTVPLQNALMPAVPIFQNIRAEHYKEAFKGLYLAIPSIKAPVPRGGRDREFDNPLYNAGEVVGASKFLQITKGALSATLPQALKVEAIEESIVFNLSEILRELFTNTHRHARTSVKGNLYSKNFRAISFNFIELSASRMDELTASGVSALFLGDWKPEGNEKFRAIDITVVDSGPGYARRWHRLDKDGLTIDLEKQAIVECFKKNRSSDLTDSSGSGLSNVLRDLKSLKGWFRLRTGRTLVEKSFFNNQGTNDISLSDINEKESFVEGVVFNVVIPLKSLAGK